MRVPLGSIRSRVFAATAFVGVLPLGGALILLATSLTHQAEEQLEREVAEAARLVERQHASRLELVAERARLLADLPKLKAAVATGDPPTVAPLAEDYRKRVQAEALWVATPGGRVLASAGAAKSEEPPAASESVQWQATGGRLLEEVTTSISIEAAGPELLGTLTLASDLDDVFARRLAILTGGDVAFLQGAHVWASSLDHDHDEALLGLTAANEARVALVGAGEFVVHRQPLSGGPEAPVALILRSRDAALAPLRALRLALGMGSLGAVVVAVLLSWALSRTVTRPLAAITSTMRQVIRTGDLTPRIGPGGRWDDEDARLLASTFDGLVESIARFQREATQRERLSALGRMSTVVAHEVRNPLMVIKGTLRTLRRSESADVREAGTDIDREVVRLDRIVGDVLDFARPLRVTLEAVALRDLFEEAVVAVFDEESRFRVCVAVDERVATVRTDAERLRAVLVNLLENAREAVKVSREPPDEVSAAGPVVEVDARAEGQATVKIVVADRGAGISPGDLPHVFEPYFTTRRTGTGLGLAIVRNAIEALGGTIRMEARDGGGSCATITLPRNPTESK